MEPKLMISDKPAEYYQHVRMELVSLIPSGRHVVLEVGCASGNTGERLRQDGRAIKVVGIEINPDVAKCAEQNIDYVICGNLELIDIPEPFGKYDYILAGDVLEHLVDPWLVMKKLKQSLAVGGKIIFSVPNIRNWTVLFPLLFFGRWEYGSFGIMDSTHLRFFTKRSILDFVGSVDMNIVSIAPAGSRIALKFHKFCLTTLVELAAVQFIVVCEKK